MHRFYDHREYRPSWVTIETTSPEFTVDQMFSEEKFCDRDGGATYVIEHWDSDTNVITFWVFDITGWYNGQAPEWTLTATSVPALVDAERGWKPTTMAPDRDYLLVSYYPNSKWPPMVRAS